MTDLKKQILSANVALCKALKSHHDYEAKHSEILQLADEIDGLKKQLASISLLADDPGQTEHGGSAVCWTEIEHANVVNKLNEAVALHSCSTYLLEVHQALESLSAAVAQLLNCAKQPNRLNDGLFWDDDGASFQWGAESQDQLENHLSASESDAVAVDQRAMKLEVDEENYKDFMDLVVSDLVKVEGLLAQPTQLNKETTVVFQGFLRTLMMNKLQLSDHVDYIWSKCFIWYDSSDGKASKGSDVPMNSGLQHLLRDFRLTSDCTASNTTANASLPSTMEMAHLLGLMSSDGWGEYETKRSPCTLSSLTVLARPGLLTQLFRLVDAQKDSADRFHELRTRLWKNIFEPWLSKTNCISDRAKGEKDWPILRTQFFDSDTAHVSDAPEQLPAWRLELIAPEYYTEASDSLIWDSCSQLTSAFQELYDHIYSLHHHKSDVGFFEHHLFVTRLIEGRFTSVIPSARDCRKTEFLAPATQTVYSLALLGKETGFFTGDLIDKFNTSLPVGEEIIGGANLLLHWIHALGRITEQRRSNEILFEMRSLLADPELFRSAQMVGTQPPPSDNLQDIHQFVIGDDEILLDEIEIQHQLQKAPRQSTTDGKYVNLPIPSLTQVLESKMDRKYLTYFSNLDQFYFPLCEVSKSIPLFIKKIDIVIKEAECNLDRLIESSADRAVGETGEESDGLPSPLRLASVLIELIPRLLITYTTIVPAFHMKLLDSDLYLACLYHNNCMFLAHECLTLGELRLIPFIERLQRAKVEGQSVQPILERLASVSTCILVPPLRTAGTDCLLQHLRLHRTQLVDQAKKAKGFRDLTDNEESVSAAIYEAFDMISATANGLKALPAALFYRCLGLLCDAFCDELVKNVFQVIDLTTPDSTILANLLQSTINEIEQYFFQHADPSVKSLNDKQISVALISRRVPKLATIKGILSILMASNLVVIDNELWADGKGPLSTQAHLKPSELRVMVEAIWCRSSARDQLLKKLH